MARFARDEDVATIVNEALAAASSATDSYQRVGASAWPIRAMVERDRHDGVDAILGRVLTEVQRIAHPIRRMDALYLLWQAVFPLGAEACGGVRDALASAYRVANGWRAGFILRDGALMLAGHDRAGAKQLADLMVNGKYKRQALRRIAAGETRRAREFFWR